MRGLEFWELSELCSCGGNNMVMVNNQGDADFACFMKVNWGHNYANFL